jgi:iron complex transport system substrate-binding protein
MLNKKHFLLGIVLIFMLVISVGCVGQQSDETSEGKSEEVVNTEKRTIKHLMGETVIDGEIEKVAVLHPWIIDGLLSIDIIPSAAVSAGPNSNESFSWYLQDRLKDTINLGWQVQPNLESILAAEPDLILTGDFHQKAYDSLSKIADTIILEKKETEDGVKDWRKSFTEIAKVFDKEDKAKKIIKEYDSKVSEARKKLEETIGNETVMFLRVTKKELRYYGAKNYQVLYEDLGLNPPAHFPDNSSTFAPLSFEKLPEVNPDHIFLLVQSEEKMEELKNNPLWQNLNAVKNNNVYIVDYDLWFQGFGPIANNLIVDQALDYLLK